MAGNCSKEDCHPHETGCNHEGCDVLTDCKFYGKDVAAKTDDVNKAEEDFFVRVPWTGNTMGLQDLNILSSNSKVNLIGITGAASAGKTTFLATLYCLLRQGASIGDYSFAGSLTLGGWESIAWYLSWKQHNSIQFPPHTSINAGRAPGLLHLSLRNTTGERKELVFTDAPGEWFEHWIANKNDPNAEGAVWIHRNADAFLLFADCEMLSGNELGKARQQTKLVADRLKYLLGKRPFGLIWSKADIEVDELIREQISGHIQNSPLENYREFQTSVREGEQEGFHSNILSSIEWIMQVTGGETNPPLMVSRHNTEDLFLSKRSV
ncbi:hypothetical protein [Asinibacterium sp. OR53]|uniref:TRAFAC clade GTPase domain-containing protein n=1 Tax=Asinibacterium sp. OR53 TaxID=925409 RepID=UPI0004B7F7F9|nr:hypothetical protein [Asinibacterium sp. OR53]